MKTNNYIKSFRIFVVLFILCCVLFGAVFLLFTPDIETNYCVDGGHFELFFPLTSLNSSIRITPEIDESLITSELKKSIPIQISADLPEIFNIAFDKYDFLKINTICEFYFADGQSLFKDTESRTISQKQINLLRQTSNLDVAFIRNIVITIYRNNNNSGKKFIVVASIRSEYGQLIEISSTETNDNVVKIYGKLKMTMSGIASTIHNDILITRLSREYPLHRTEQWYFGKYIIVSENNEIKKYQ
jgi:hypothetical protein